MTSGHGNESDRCKAPQAWIVQWQVQATLLPTAAGHEASCAARTVTLLVALRHTNAGLLSMPVTPQGWAMRLFRMAFGHDVQPFGPH